MQRNGPPTFDFQTAREGGQTALRRGLLDVAAALLAEEGPGALSLRALTRRANCSTKVVYTLFGGRDGLAEALFLQGFDILQQAVERERRRHRDRLKALEPACLAYRDMALEYPHYFGVMFGTSLAGYDPAQLAHKRAWLSLQALTAAVRGAQEQLGRSEGDEVDVAIRLWAAVHGPVALELRGFPPFDTQGERLARQAVRDVLAAVGLARAEP
jgi:AcrR family transcriptional regulator